MAMNNQFVIITGMSGAGKTVAMQSFEDLGYFCVDNMPPTLLPRFKELIRMERDINKIALVIDLRSQVFYDEIIGMFDDLKKDDDVDIIFLDASDAKLVSRYKETRRAHPLARNGRVIDGIQKERELLANVKKAADLVVDTTNMSPRRLREEVFHNFESTDTTHTFHVEVMSFGFKYGLPLDADIVMDVRFLPNPYYDPNMRFKTGLDESVAAYVMHSQGARPFYNKLLDILKFTLPGYEKEGKASLTIAIGCTGGQHRSVAIAQQLGNDLQKQYPKYPVNITHRDIERHKGKGEN
ncbi:RNase adapter RapZ [Lentilactobacillus farraginis]|uniref:ATP-binding protein n=1 Tax=Lentilactobacillus farraginis DSM 18382 = JCM 14108 TaxID=1423743 RepID=X0PBZ0_9LACO|nr:RNase adapter RapZ [Lentilactobacillus farraginis]KRM10780.1 ATP-binding protein [Lentilactobacillus farraginis DSM 18382 = JCM 14108]GAF37623.1 ATP-binding protein [Lentilactobacillus farraginis DSM 18382 = JCM 14108]